MKGGYCYVNLLYRRGIPQQTTKPAYLWHNLIMHQNSPHIPLVVVVAMEQHSRAIGNNNQLLWHVPADLKRFKALTLGHPIIMGRKTFDSILEVLGKPLPGRTNIVLTRDRTYIPEGAEVAHSFEEAIALATKESPTEIHIGGGAELYRQALPYVDYLHVTWFFADVVGDTFFPEFEEEFTVVTEHPTQEHEGLRFQWVDYTRKS
jgi:dihydrofolate reductase